MKKDQILVLKYNNSIIEEWSKLFPFKTIEFEFTSTIKEFQTLNGFDLIIIDSNSEDKHFLQIIDDNHLLKNKKIIYFYSCFLKEYENKSIDNLYFIKYPSNIHEFKYILSKQLETQFTNHSPDFDFLSKNDQNQDQPTLNEQLLNTSPIKRINQLKEGSSIKFKKDAFLNKILEVSQNLYYLYDFELDEYYFLNNSLFEFFEYDSSSKKDFYKNIMNIKDYEYYINNIIPKILSLKNNEFYEFQFQATTKNNYKLELLAKEFIYTRNKKNQAKLLLGTISDISFEHEIKEKIKNSLQREKLLNEVYHNSPIGIVYSTYDQKLFNPNQMYCDLIGYSKSEIENMSWIDLTPSEFLDDELDMLSLLSPDRNLIKYEKEYIHKNENRVPVEVVIYAQFDELNNIDYYVGFFQSIGLRKNIEAHQDGLLIKMNKRINELQCLSDISQLIQKENNISTIINKLIEIIPSGWQFPSNTAVRIKFKDQEYKSQNITNSNCSIQEPIIIEKVEEGFIEISYNNQKIFNDPSYFLEEEKELLNNISIIVSEKFENINNNEKLQKLNLSLKEKIIESGNDFSKLQNRFELAKYSAKIGLWEWNLINDEMIWDEIMYQIFEIPIDENASISYDLRDQIIFKLRNKLLNYINQCVENAQDFNDDFEITTITGKNKFIHIFGHPIVDDHNKTQLIIGLLWDVTKTKKLEMELNEEQKKLEEILNSSPIAFAISTDDKLVFFNDTFKNMTGLSVGDSAEKLYRNVTDRIFLKEELKNKKEFTNFDLEIVNKDGKYIHTLAYFYQTKFNGKDSIKGWMIDISELKKTEYELAKARDVAVSATQAKTQFLANMSHEIRTPMNAILGYAQMLKRDENLNQQQKESLDVINRSGEMLLSLINDILDLSKIESGILTIENETYDFCQMLSEIKNMFSHRIKKKGLDFDINIQDDFPRFVYGDKRKIKQVIVNLMSNAIKFTLKGSIIININFEKINSTDIYISVKVKDTGIGINQKYKDKIFDYFEQGDSEISKNSGTGLGIAISRQYAQLMQGNVILKESVLNNGSEFEFTFINQIADGKAENINDEYNYVKSIKQTQTPPKILILDKDRSNLNLLSTQLKNIGFKVCSYSNTENVLKEFENIQPDFIFLGIEVPYKNTLNFIRNIKDSKYGKEIPIFVISATIFNEDLSEKINQSKVDGLILKPYDIEKIFSILQDNLNIEYEYYNQKLTPQIIEEQYSINQELIDKLSKSWKKNIKTHIHQGDIEKIRKLIDDLDDEFSQLKLLFTTYIDQYNYQDFLNILEGREKNV